MTHGESATSAKTGATISGTPATISVEPAPRGRLRHPEAVHLRSARHDEAGRWHFDDFGTGQEQNHRLSWTGNGMRAATVD